MPTGPWTSGDGETVEVAGEVFDPEAGRAVPCVTVRMPFWRSEHLSSVLEKWTRIGEVLGDDSESERALAQALAAAARSARTLRDARNAG